MPFEKVKCNERSSYECDKPKGRKAGGVMVAMEVHEYKVRRGGELVG
jgi:hypothetical protein